RGCRARGQVLLRNSRVEVRGYRDRKIKTELVMLRVRVHDYKKIGPDWCPFLADGRQVHIAAQPSAAEAFLAMPEQEGLLSGPRGTGKTVTSAMTYLQHVGQG